MWEWCSIQASTLLAESGVSWSQVFESNTSRRFHYIISYFLGGKLFNFLCLNFFSEQRKHNKNYVQILYLYGTWYKDGTRDMRSDQSFSLDLPLSFPTMFSKNPFPYLQNENIQLNCIPGASLSWSETIINHSFILEHTIFLFSKSYLSTSCRYCAYLCINMIVWTTADVWMLIFGAFNNIVIQFMN